MTKHSSDSFICWYCEKSLENDRYVIQDSFASCLSCFEEKYSKRCFHCNQIIGIEVQVRTCSYSCFISWFLSYRGVYFKIKRGIILVSTVLFVKYH